MLSLVLLMLSPCRRALRRQSLPTRTRVLQRSAPRCALLSATRQHTLHPPSLPLPSLHLLHGWSSLPALVSALRIAKEACSTWLRSGCGVLLPWMGYRGPVVVHGGHQLQASERERLRKCSSIRVENQGRDSERSLNADTINTSEPACIISACSASMRLRYSSCSICNTSLL